MLAAVSVRNTTPRALKLTYLGHVKADCPSVRGPFGGFAGGAGPGAFAGAQKCYQCGRVGVWIGHAADYH